MSEGDAPDSRWERRFHRERRARKEAERLLQDKSRELYDANIQLKTLLRTLEQRVEDRTREADAARRKAEAASEAKTRFLATMSHEIRTPMNGVVGMADFLSTTPLNTEQRASVDTIQTASSTLRRLLDDILDFSRLESGKLELSPTEFSVQNLIRDLIALHRPTAERRGLLIHSEVDPTMPAAVIGDRLRIGQVLGNLINNAIKFTETGSIRILARWRASALHVSVIDTGIGITEASREHLFQRFAQADSSTSRTHGGSGLGLAICQELVALMGGEISLHPTTTVGTRIDVYLPLSAATRASERQGSDALMDPPSLEQGSLDGLTVLVIDDNPINLMVATRLLEWLGCSVDTRPDGPSGVDAALLRTYSAVLMDIHMPQMDGFEATKLLREREHQSHPSRQTPVFALTADAIAEVAVRCARAGMKGLIPKPVTRELLYRHLSPLTCDRVNATVG